MGNLSPFGNKVGVSYNQNNINTFGFMIQQSNATNPLSNTYAPFNNATSVISHTMPIGNPDSNKLTNDSICNLFNSEQPQDVGIGISGYNVYTENDIYKLFYSNRVSNLYDKKTRFLTGNFYLKLSEYINLKANDIIKIKEQYFLWNKIDQFNFTNKELTKIELLQINNDINTYPTRYFKYQYNDTGCIFKFRTYFNPEENPYRWVDGYFYEPLNSIRRTNYYWSILYDYYVGSLSGNVASYVTSYQKGTERYMVKVWEVTEADYNASGLFHTSDTNDKYFIKIGRAHV